MQFVDAPPAQRRRALTGRWLEVVESLKAMPNEWGLVGSFSPGTATGIRRGKYRAFTQDMPAGHDPEEWVAQNWEITTRKTDSGSRNDVYIRYIGG